MAREQRSFCVIWPRQSAARNHGLEITGLDPIQNQPLAWLRGNLKTTGCMFTTLQHPRRVDLLGNTSETNPFRNTAIQGFSGVQ